MPTLNFSLFNCSAGLISFYFIVAGFRLIQRYTVLLSLTTQNYHRVTMIPHYADKKLYAAVKQFCSSLAQQENHQQRYN